MASALKNISLVEETASTQGSLICYEGGTVQTLPELRGQEEKFTFKWDSREVFLGKAMKCNKFLCVDFVFCNLTGCVY